MIKIAVVILNWNGKDLLEKFLPSVIRFSNPEITDIYVADNASTDDSVLFIQHHFTTIKIIQNSENGGYAKGYNDALKHIKADFFALVNSDIEVTPNWLEPIIEHFEHHQNTAIIQPKILDYKNREYFEYAGAAGGFIDEFGYPFCRGRIFDTVEKDTSRYDYLEDIFWASGACFFVRSEVFKKLNGFDESYFAHQEEIDFCWRAKNFGYDIKYIPNSVVYHVGGATLSVYNPKKTFLNFRNSLITLLKNLPPNKVIGIIFSRLILDGIAGIKFLFELQPKHTFAIIKAHFSFYKNVMKNWRKRKDTPNKIINYYHTKSIVYQYYIKKKKVFTAIIPEQF
ncbi:MAG: glycosyltransferase family 2 protein [Flavobacteriaceae bacterium]|nr:glycosyltransferase family 2 protein [Flavobacteriaceae bacterium]